MLGQGSGACALGSRLCGAWGQASSTGALHPEQVPANWLGTGCGWQRNRKKEAKGWQHSLQLWSGDVVLGTTTAPSRPTSAGEMQLPQPQHLPLLPQALAGASCPALA